jgi:hypothetical protein
MSTSTTQAAVDQFLRKHQLFSFAKHKPLRIGTTFVKPPDMTDAQFAAYVRDFDFHEPKHLPICSCEKL